MQGISASSEKKPCKVFALVAQNAFRRFIRHVRMSQSAALATQNDIRTCFEGF
jgi:hypothetical protein